MCDAVRSPVRIHPGRRSIGLTCVTVSKEPAATAARRVAEGVASRRRRLDATGSTSGERAVHSSTAGARRCAFCRTAHASKLMQEVARRRTRRAPRHRRGHVGRDGGKSRWIRRLRTAADLCRGLAAAHRGLPRLETREHRQCIRALRAPQVTLLRTVRCQVVEEEVPPWVLEPRARVVAVFVRAIPTAPEQLEVISLGPRKLVPAFSRGGEVGRHVAQQGGVRHGWATKGRDELPCGRVQLVVCIAVREGAVDADAGLGRPLRLLATQHRQ